METLKTYKGSKIQRSKFGVGKQMGSKVYVAIQYLPEICDAGVLKEAKLLLRNRDIDIGMFKCACYDLKKPWMIRFDVCEGFDRDACPVVGWQYFVDTYDDTVKKKYCPQCFHSKWLWCKDDYTGFDVKESWEWSRKWLSVFRETASGYPDKWEKQLEKYGLK